jgi:hypothetical protein
MNIQLTWAAIITMRAALLNCRDVFPHGSKEWKQYDDAYTEIVSGMELNFAFEAGKLPEFCRQAG